MNMLKLDYSIDSPEERCKLVQEILDTTPPSLKNNKFLESLASYIIFSVEKQNRTVMNESKQQTINKRERSLETLATKLEHGEDALIAMMREDKNQIFRPKVSITEQDIKDIPELRQLHEEIDTWQKMQKKAEGKDVYTIKKAIIEMRRDQYLIKGAYKPQVITTHLNFGPKPVLRLDESIVFNEATQKLEYSGFTLLDSKVVSALLCNYSKIKENSYEDFEGDLWYIIMDLENLIDKALADKPIFLTIVKDKIDGRTGNEIRKHIEEDFGVTYTVEQISKFWRHTIPKSIATKAQEQYITYYFKKTRKPLKKCGKCGQKKPTHSMFFSKNSGSKDGFYSICKECRRRKK